MIENNKYLTIKFQIFSSSLLTMLERGDVNKIKAFLLPDMPHCIESSQFSSAKLSDVFTAFGLVLIVMVISFGISKLT